MKNKRAKLNPVRKFTSGGHPKRGKISNGVNPLRCMLYSTLAGGLLVFMAGCENADRKKPPDRIERLTQQNMQLQRQIERSKAESKQLKKQIQVLSGLKPEVKLENLRAPQSVKIHKYSGFYDKDGDGRKEKLIVYIQPIDEQGDIIKAPGAVEVQLWNLNKSDSQALLGQWHVKADELKQNWFSTLIKGNYRLMFDVADKVENFEEPLTVKATFTDYLTGKVFKEQRVIKP